MYVLTCLFIYMAVSKLSKAYAVKTTVIVVMFGMPQTSHLLATGPELPTDYSLENTSDLTHSLTLWITDLSLPRTILWKTPLI